MGSRSPDGNLWFAEDFGNQIGRIDPGGTITEFPVPTADSRPTHITTGPGGNPLDSPSSVTRVATGSGGSAPPALSPNLHQRSLWDHDSPGRQPLVHRAWACWRR